jgi:hypothetical protein
MRLAMIFCLDLADARAAVSSQRMFNLMHLQSGIKVDFIVRKGTEYREMEFNRRRAVEFRGVGTFIVSREDLLLSKLVWGMDSHSEMQRRDVAALVHPSLDRAYLRRSAGSLGVASDLEGVLE